ncbi:MAG: xanthine dehydrogenase family protein subunit M [Fuerstiella sp.]|nr:xanthine dehydrogenase family protein subunit M [Fuerstiella sp.]MCP4855982.1 xanthine dehydrogenase family protein subunit M [Fuerstiella sp.]
MINFEYAAPTRLDEAIKQLAKAGTDAKVLAGGTDIIVQLREGLRSAELVVDVKKIPELMRLELSSEQGLHLGASVSCRRIHDDKNIAAEYPGLVDAVRIIGSWQIQSRASVGGNLCNSSPAADGIPPLIAYAAQAHVAGPDGQRVVPVEEFCTGPGQNILQQGELLVALTLPPQQSGTGSAYQRFIPRNEMDIAVAGAASWVQLDADGKRIEQARIALSAVAPTPVFAAEASGWLAGQTASEEVFAQAGELAKRDASPIDDMRGTAEYRTHLVGVLTKRTLATACERARN